MSVNMPIEVIFVSDIVEANGKTVRENNMAIEHKIPLGTLVEVKYDTWFGGGACERVHARLWVVGHTRDCDGTPLYLLGQCRGEPNHHTKNGFGEESLTPIAVTKEIIDGEGALTWEEDGE